MSNPTDEQLMDRSLAGDQAAFAALCERHADAVTSHLVRYGFSPEVASEIARTALAGVSATIDRYEPGVPVGPWLCTAAISAATHGLSQIDGADVSGHLAIVERMEAMYADALRAHDIDGLSPEDSATRLGVTPNTFQRLLLRARRMLAIALADRKHSPGTSTNPGL